MNGNEQNCLKCGKEIVEDYYQCDVCTKKIHIECSKLSSSEVRCMPLQKRLLIFSCDNCKEVIKGIPKLLLLMEDVKKQLEYVKNQNSQITPPLPTMSTKKYSEVVRKTQEEVIVVIPKDKKQDSTTTKKDIEEQIDPSTIGAQVSRVKYIRDGGVAISCTKREDINKISQNITQKMNNKYEIKVPEKKNPKLKIINLEKKMTENQDILLENIVLQNGITTDEGNKSMKVIKIYEDKRKKSNTVILEVDLNTYKQISRREVLHIGWRKCRFFDYVNIIQCYKCWKFGHMSGECTNSDVICPKCSENHKIEVCKSSNEICVNCKYAKEVLKMPHIDFLHTAFNRKCESYQRIFQQLQTRVEYPDMFGNNK